MKRRLYPAVLERGVKGTFGAWFPDFPGCVAAGKSQQETIEKAEHKLAQTVDELAEHDRPLPLPTPIERIVIGENCIFSRLRSSPPWPRRCRGSRSQKGIRLSIRTST
jgi:predicted RNase H-like HicB family nuclease